MPVTTASKPILGVPQLPLRRSSSGGVLGGVCAGLAVRLGVRDRTIRVMFSVGALFFGFGLLLYVVVWLFLTRSGEDASIGSRLASKRRRARSLLLSLVVILAVLALLNALNLRGTGGFAWSLALSAIGLFAIWHGSSPEEKAHLEGLINAAPVMGAASSRGWKALVLRVVPGIVLVVVGLQILNRIGGVWGAAVPALLGAVVLLVGLLVLLAPWWLQNVRDLSSERRERVRIEERASMVAHIHDSVLQTLTLIERAAASESDVIRLARAQERELRQWLFNPDSVGISAPTDGSFATLLGAVENDVENDYGVKVQLVVVGDCPSDEKTRLLVAAGREAAINAAKWSTASTVSIFGEVEPAKVSLFVRDTGKGFDPDAVASDRQGIVLSIKQRMAQIGGATTIRSTLGHGTEVELVLPRAVVGQ
jgi:signal transduction histidine kinase